MPAIFYSSRFWGIVVVGVLEALVLFNVITGEQGEGLIRIIQGILGSAVLVGSLDRVGKKAV